MNPKEFNASLDFFAKFLGVALIAFVAITELILISILHSSSEMWIGIAIVGSSLPIMLIAYFYSPKKYIVSDCSIEIKRIAGIFTISRNDIRGVRSITKKELGMVWRMAGNGGLFGYTGWYSAGIGKVRMFATQKKNFVLITMKNQQKYLLSPDDAEAFVQASKTV